jgi:hypothetical protein
MITYHVAPSLLEIAYGRSNEQHVNMYLVATELLNRRLRELHQARTQSAYACNPDTYNKHDKDNENNNGNNNGNCNKWSIFFAYPIGQKVLVLVKN